MRHSITSGVVPVYVRPRKAGTSMVLTIPKFVKYVVELADEYQVKVLDDGGLLYTPVKKIKRENNMVSKNNRNLYQKKYEDNKQRWTLRKYSFGVASVMIGITFGMMNITESAHADVTSTVNTTEATMVPVNNQGNNQDSSDKSNSSQTVSVADLVDKGTNDSSQVTPKMLLASKLATDNQSTTATNGLSYGSQGSVNPSFPQGYPANYWKDPVQNRYSFEVLGLTTDGTIKGSKYYAVLSTNNNGDGSLYVTFINRSTNKPIVNTRQVSEKAEWIDNRTFGLSANKNWWIKKIR